MIPNASMPMPEPDERHAENARPVRAHDDIRFPELLKNWKIVNPKLMSESEVRITDISVRSALMRVRWNDIPVLRIDISVRLVDRSVRYVDRSVRCSESWVRCSDRPVR